jgi:hypothetical protein
MAILNGDKIEKLLWDSGLDFEHRTGIDGFSSVEVPVGGVVVSVSETWQDAEDWYLDTDTLLFVVTADGEEIREDYEMVSDEVALVQYIASYGE